MIVTFALNYGGRWDIIEAAKKAALDIASGALAVDNLTELQFANYLSTAGLSEPDLVIRTSGEMRVSNFLIWQSAYAEYWFTSTLWPDFSKEKLFEAVIEYGKRKRRFGDVQDTKKSP